MGTNSYFSLCKDVNICELPPEVGPCQAYDPRFFFNYETGECEQFIFGGCDGNDNNFKTLEECHLACDGKLLGHIWFLHTLAKKWPTTNFCI